MATAMLDAADKAQYEESLLRQAIRNNLYCLPLYSPVRSCKLGLGSSQGFAKSTSVFLLLARL